jgi:hypothetical protein
MEEIKYNHLLEALEDYADLLKDEIITILKAHKKDGKIDKTLKFWVNVLGTKYQLNLDIEDYFKYIESGRRKGAKQPPINAILKWIKQKNILPKIDKKLKPKQLAFVIARSISKNGIKALPILNKSISKINKSYKFLLIEALHKDVQEILLKDNTNTKL